MELKIPVEVDLNGIDCIVDEIKHLQTYKLFAGDDMVLVRLDDVAEILINHIEARRKAEPQRMRGRWIEDGYNDEKAVCDQCGEPCATYIMGKPRDKYCKWCGADMREE